MRKLYAALGILATIFITAPLYAQITVYNNDYTGSGGAGPVPGGIPSLTFVETNSVSAPSGSAGEYFGGSFGSTTFTPNQLALWVSAPTSAGTDNGYAEVSGPLSGYASPFATTLSSNLGLVTWTFNMRISTPETGFAANQNSAVTILAATDPSFSTAGTGYAVSFDPGVAGGAGVQLIEYNGGLTGTVTTVVSSAVFLASPTNYASIKVIYNPYLNQWTLFVRDDGPLMFSDPALGVLVSGGSTIEGTYTGLPMTVFGCYSNFSVDYSATSTNVQYGYFDNLTVTVSCPSITGGLNLCVGTTTALSDPATGGVWSSEFPGIATVNPSTGVVSGVTTGTSTISYSDGLCVMTAVVSVNPTPIPPPITGTMHVCAGLTTTLGDAMPGGSWSSSVPAVGTVGTTGVVTGISGGTTTITYFVPGACFTTAVYTVNPLGVPMSGVFAECEGDVFTFSDLGGPGTWLSDNSFVATVDPSSGLVTAVGEGTATITYTSPFSCTTSSVVTVNPLPPVATGTPVVCEGLTTTLTSSGSAAIFWSASPATTADVADATVGVVTGILTGTATITYKYITGCLRTIVVTVNDAVSITSTVSAVCVGTTVTLTAVPAGGSWSSTTGAGTIDPTSGALTGISSGTTVVSYTMPTGCYQQITINVNPQPSPITGTLSVCQGLTTPLLSGPPGGTWSSSSMPTGTVSASGVVTGISANTTTITYTIPGTTGCYQTATVTVNPLPTAITGLPTVCEAASTPWASTPTGGTWSSGGSSNASVGSSSGSVGGSLAGTANITYTAPLTGCTTTRVMTVIPEPAAFTGALSVCVGSTTTLNTTTTPITWSSGFPAIGSVDAATGVVTGISNGNTPITGTGSNGCGRTVTVTVNPLPSNITGTALFCSGSTTSFSDVTSGGTWSATPVSTAFFTNPFTGTATGGSTAGTATVTYKLFTGCYSTKIATVEALPSNITGTTSVCIGLTTTLSSGVGGTWSSSNSSLAPVTPGGVVTGSGTTGGIATITYMLGTGCYRTTDVTVNTNPGTITGPLSLCPATSVTLNSTPAAVGTWTNSPTAFGTINSTTGVFTGIATGTTTVTYTLPTTCITTIVVTVVTAPTAVITPLGDTALCPGDFVTLTSTTTPGVTYSWYQAGMALPGATSPTLLTYTAGSYQVLVSVVAGCSTLSSPMSVSVLPATATIAMPGGSSGCSATGVLLDGTAGAGISYQWKNATGPIAGATDATYTALTTDVYTLVISNSTGCSATSAPQPVVIHPSPAGSLTLSGPLNICAGTTVTMSAAAGLTYQWYNAASGSITGATNAAFTTGAAGAYYVTETNATTGCVATSITNNVFVNPLPDASISHPGGSTAFCAGGSLALFAGAAGAAYQWYVGSAPITGATNGIYVATVSGNYKVKVTDPVTGCTAMTSPATTVTVVSAVTVTPLTPAKFCWGGSSLLSTSVSSVGALASYQWFFGSGAIPGATDGSYLATVAGNYSCTVTIPGGCSVTTPVIAVVENPLPDPIVSFNGTAMATAPFYVTYQWYKGLSVIPGATASSTPATGNGSYKVGVTDTNGCQSVSTYYVLTNWTGGTTGLTEINNGEVKIYPNPAKAMLHIESAEEVSAVITGIDGRELMRVNNAKDIDISRLADGVYMIAVYNNNHLLLKTEKLVKASE